MKPAVPTPRSLYDSNPPAFWKILSASLVVLVAMLLAWR